MSRRSSRGYSQDYDYDEESAGEQSGPNLLHWVWYALRATSRHKLVAAGVFLFGVGASIAYYSIQPKFYRAEASILAQRQEAISSVTRSGGSEDEPTRVAWELVHRRDNLLAVIDQAKLPLKPASPARPSPLAWFQRLLSPEPAEDDPLNRMVFLLDRALKVKISEGTVSISIDWRNPQQAYQIVKAAVENFLEARHVQEVTAIDEVIALMQARLTTLSNQLEKTSLEARRQAAFVDPLMPLPHSTTSAPPDPATTADDENGPAKLVQLKSMIAAKERAIADVDEFRRRRLTDLQAQLDQTLTVYSEQHPTIITLRQDIEALSRESPQVVTLREEEQKLRNAYAARLAQDARVKSAAPRSPVSAAPRPAPSSPEQSESVREARLQYEQLAERVNSAQIQLDAARAAFKYRYDVLWPPQVPKTPISPNPRKIFGLGPLASLLLAMLAAAFVDWRTGRIVERWQVEHELNLPVLAELDRK